MSYTQLTEVERYQIQSFLKAGYTQQAIAKELGRDPGTISRELGRAIQAYADTDRSRRIVLPLSANNITLVCVLQS